MSFWKNLGLASLAKSLFGRKSSPGVHRPSHRPGSFEEMLRRVDPASPQYDEFDSSLDEFRDEFLSLEDERREGKGRFFDEFKF